MLCCSKALPYPPKILGVGNLSSTDEVLFPLFSLFWLFFSFFPSSTASTIQSDIAISHRQNVRVCDSSLNAFAIRDRMSGLDCLQIVVVLSLGSR